MSIFEAAIGLLAPPECLNCAAEGSSLCGPCSRELIKPFGEHCWRCNALSLACKTCQSCRRTGSPAFVWIVTDHDSTARDLLSLYKFGHNRAAADSVSRLMVERFLEFSKADNYLVIPIPTATSRVRERGFGHTELLAKKISVKLNLEYSASLRRLGQSRQLGASREARLKQLNSSFAINNSKSFAGRKVLLVDDVVTTGGTIIAAAQALRAAGASQIDALLFAKRL